MISHFNNDYLSFKDKSAYVARLQRDLYESNKTSNDINLQLIKELKDQLKIEQDKLKTAQQKVSTLENEKSTLELELDDLMKKFMAATSDLEAMVSKANGLEDELRQERLQRQQESSQSHPRKQAWVNDHFLVV